MSKKPSVGRTTHQTSRERKRIDLHIREIFEEEATKKDALAKAIRYMFENDPIVAVHAYLKLMSIKNSTTSPINSVTNIFAEQVNAPQLIAHMEDVARLAEGPCDATSVPHEPVLFADSGSETH